MCPYIFQGNVGFRDIETFLIMDSYNQAFSLSGWFPRSLYESRPQPIILYQAAS